MQFDQSEIVVTEKYLLNRFLFTLRKTSVLFNFTYFTQFHFPLRYKENSIGQTVFVQTQCWKTFNGVVIPLKIYNASQGSLHY